MCEPTFEEWFLSFAAERERLTGVLADFDNAYDRYFPAFEDGICGGTCARLSERAYFRMGLLKRSIRPYDGILFRSAVQAN